MTQVADRPVMRQRELAVVAGCFLTYGAIFFDRLVPLYLVVLIAGDLGAPTAAQGTLALLIGLGWAASMPLLRVTTGRVDDRTRVVGGVTLAAVLGFASAGSGSSAASVVLRGLGGITAAGSDTVPPRWAVFGILLLCGVAMGSLPLMISIVPAEAVATGDVGRALLAPIAVGEIVGSAALPLAAGAAAIPLGFPVVVTLTALGVIGLVPISMLLRPMDPGGGARPGDVGGACG